ncbi:putative integral membrane protein [Neofusicoccum parvum]|nr:putative integral membrane protein [Neofusicoccum parvum]
MEDSNRGPEYFVVLVVMICMALTATLLRILVRVSIVKAFGRDDWFMVAATLAFIMYTTCALGGIHYGTGRRNADLTPESTMKAMRFWWCCYVAYTSTMWFAKVSIGFFLLRLTVHPVHIRIIWTAMIATAVTGIVFTFVTLFQCQPVAYFWTRFLGTQGKCLNIIVVIGLTYFYSAVNALCDFTFGLLPLFMLWNLNMSKRMKLALAPILSMACIASCAILVRTAYCNDYLKPDFLYSTVNIAIWSTVECGLAITAGSLATLRPLFRVLNSRLRSHASAPASAASSAARRQQTAWPGSRDRNNHSGPWSLLRTELADFELASCDQKGAQADVESLHTAAAASERGLVVGREGQGGGEREEGRKPDGEGKRRSWMQVVAGEGR